MVLKQISFSKRKEENTFFIMYCPREYKLASQWLIILSKTKKMYQGVHKRVQHCTSLCVPPITQPRLQNVWEPRTAKLEALFRALLSIKPTLKKSECALCVEGNFCTKVRSRTLVCVSMFENTLQASKISLELILGLFCRKFYEQKMHILMIQLKNKWVYNIYLIYLLMCYVLM